MVTGSVVGVVAYAAVLLPIVIATRPSDVSAGESFGIALALGLPLGLVVIIGSMVGAALGAGYKTIIGKRRQRKRSAKTPS